MARARVELINGRSDNKRGRKWKRGEAHYITNASDIAAYEVDGRYKVVHLESPTPAVTPVGKELVSPEALTSAVPSDDETDDVPAYPAWHPNDNKPILEAAAIARGIAVVPKEKKADIIEMLQDFDNSIDGVSG